ncbi:MAG TPA: DinB family protein [Anaerolineales bacterium]|nr:DinB family protein [Anaerolineales bacterium]
MFLTLLLDLDDTLLDTNLEAFVPAYFQALSQYMAGRVAPTAMLRALVQGMYLMNENENPTRTLEEVFDAYFYPNLGVTKEDLLDVLEEFYDNVFPALAEHTRVRPDAAGLIEWALGCGFRVAIATDPLMPRKATYHRVRWAGLDPERLELITTFDHFHFSKTHPAYYAEVLGRLGWPDGPVLMVGNDLARDLAPAHRLGLATYLVEAESGSNPGSIEASPDGFVRGRGRLSDLRPWLESVDLSTLEPSFKSRQAVLGIMASTPAVLRSLSASLTEQQWRREPARDDWALNEIVCHLRDTEREVHHMQLNLLLERPETFIPRPDTSVWARERDYLHENGPAALTDFATARLEMLDRLKSLGGEVWARKARHAIFGPTDFTEIIGFTADHDRLHVQQAWRTLQNV